MNLKFFVTKYESSNLKCKLKFIFKFNFVFNAYVELSITPIYGGLFERYIN